MATGDVLSKGVGESSNDATAFLVLDTESIPDGRLLSKVKYAAENLSPAEAIQRAQAEARELSPKGSDFLPVSFQVPVAVCVLRVTADFRLRAVRCLDAPHFRPQRIVEEFWRGLAYYQGQPGNRIKLVSFNGRGFDLPLLELSAFRYGCCAGDYFLNSRNRYNGEIDLLDWLTNYGACRLAGGLDLFSKILGKPGKMDVSGEQVYGMYLDGKIQDINDYCLFDTLDTYFVFLRTRVMRGDISLETEQAVVGDAKAWLAAKSSEIPALRKYLENWGDWQPWP